MASSTVYKNGVPFYTVNVNASVSSQTDTTATISWSANIAFGDWAWWGVGLNVYVDGAHVGSTQQACTGSYQTVCVLSGSRTVDKSTSARNVGFSASSYSATVGGYGGVGSVTTASGNVYINAGVFATIPGAPSNPEVTKESDEEFTISWDINLPASGGITNNLLQVSINDGSFTDVSTSIGGSTTSYSYTTGEANSKYIFRIASRNSAGTSAYTTTPAIYTTPAAPLGGWGVQYGQNVGVSLNISDTRYPDTYEWQRSSNGTSWTTIGEKTSYAGLTEETSIRLPYYRARVYAPDGETYSAYGPSFQPQFVPQIFCNVPDGETLKSVYVNSENEAGVSGLWLDI